METLSLFIKPWMKLNVEEIIKRVKFFGIKNIELPIRAGGFINPENCEEELLKLYNLFKNEGITITSIAGNIDERIFKAMHKTGIEYLRIMLPMKAEESFFDSFLRFKEMLKEGEEYSKKYNAKIIIQPHNGRYISNVYELYCLIKECNPKYIRAIWDLGHSGLLGEPISKTVDIIFDYLDVVNFKSAYFKKTDNTYKPFYTIGEESPVNWSEAVDYLLNKGYKGSFCIHAEYTNPLDISKYTEEDNTDEFLEKDILYIKKIFEK